MKLPALILSSDLARIGRDSRSLARQAEAGVLRRLRQGVYVPAEAWDALQPWERYPLLIHAAATTLRSRTVFCRQSAAALSAIPVLGTKHPVHACTSDAGGGRSRAGVRRHFADPQFLHVEERQGLLVTARARTVLDLAAFGSFEQAVTAVDHVLRPTRNGPAVLDVEKLEAGITGIYTAAAARRIVAALEFGDPASGSPGESVSRAMMHRLGFKAPVLQYEIRDARGLVGFSDFEWPEDGISGEFDGLMKYRADAYLKGLTPSDVVIEEKLVRIGSGPPGDG